MAFEFALIEQLESRRLLAVVPPTNPRAAMIYGGAPDEIDNLVSFQWDNNNTAESGYRAEWSTDNANWQTLGPILNPDATATTQVLDADPKHYYRVIALDGSNPESPPSTVVRPETPPTEVNA